jgi:SAM-dependent MidA family methyltransferase
MQDRIFASLLRQRIEASGGWIPFDQFMQAALYEPGLGYYESAEVFGAEGDFVTAADLGPWLAKGFADLIVWGWQAMGKPSTWTLMEQGGGSGALLCAVVEALQALGLPLPARIVAVEASARMRARQAEAYAGAGLAVEQVPALTALGPLDACMMFCNELPDAFPVRCLVRKGDGLHERGVAWHAAAPVWADADAPMHEVPSIDPALWQAWPEGYVTEWNPGLEAWQRELATTIRHGLVFCVDYGFAQQEYYRPNRVGGTLLAHHRHRAEADVLADPGSRDITAHVDFTALTKAGRMHGLHGTAFMSQGAWLAQSPSVQSHIAALAGATDARSLAQMAQVKRLLLPSGMGELFKLLIQRTDGFGQTATLPPFLSRFDRLRDLVSRA